MIHRQRPRHSPAQLNKMYAGPHDHRVLGYGHDARVTTTITIGRFMDPEPLRVADLSCGNGVIARGLKATEETILGDFAPGFKIRGPIEKTIEKVVFVDIFVCSETLEHLDDPEFVLTEIRKRSRMLLATVPLCRPGHPEDDQNGEHYWAFDREGFEELLASTGWEPKLFAEVPAAPGSVNATYQCGIWGCQ